MWTSPKCLRPITQSNIFKLLIGSVQGTSNEGRGVGAISHTCASCLIIQVCATVTVALQNTFSFMGTVLVKIRDGKNTFLLFLNTPLSINAILWVTEKSPVDHLVGGLARRLVLFQELVSPGTSIGMTNHTPSFDAC